MHISSMSTCYSKASTTLGRMRCFEEIKGTYLWLKRTDHAGRIFELFVLSVGGLVRAV